MQDKIRFGFRRNVSGSYQGDIKKTNITCRSLDLIFKDRLLFTFGLKKKHFID